jgi:hypothetical protein
VTPTPSPAPAPVSLLERHTLVTFYGRGFDVAPILGMLGGFKDADDMDRQIKQRFVEPIDALNGAKGVVPAIHLIYALAVPCEGPRHDCLFYLDEAGFDVVEEYIKPAAARGWQVILDAQHGRSTSMEQVERMIARGYLKYENVHVALDPEFHVYPGETLPGIPIGQIDAAWVNEVGRMLDEEVRANGLKQKKILIVHQFGDANVNDGVPPMIQNKSALRTFPNVDLVIDADGFGGQGIKVEKYNRITDREVYPFIRWRGIKVFYPNPYEQAGHYDQPPLTPAQLMGQEETDDGHRIQHPPDVIIIA